MSFPRTSSGTLTIWHIDRDGKEILKRYIIRRGAVIVGGELPAGMSFNLAKGHGAGNGWHWIWDEATH